MDGISEVTSAALWCGVNYFHITGTLGCFKFIKRIISICIDSLTPLLLLLFCKELSFPEWPVLKC